MKRNGFLIAIAVILTVCLLPVSALAEGASCVLTLIMPEKGFAQIGGSADGETYTWSNVTHSYEISEATNFYIQAETKPGYAFNNWLETKEELLQPASTPSTNPYKVSELTMATKYEPTASLIEYKLTYVLNGGTLDAAASGEYTVESPEFEIYNPTKVGYDFTGWTGTEVPEKNTHVVIAAGSIGDREFTANYDATVYTLSYELNAGALAEGETNPSEYTIESEDITLNNPTKRGNEFKGWMELPDDEPKPVVTIVTGSTGNKEYEASWALKTYALSYALNSGTVDTPNPETYDMEDEITLNNPTKDGYDFAGWTGTDVDEKNTHVVIAVGSIGDREFTANYDAIEYKLSYELSDGVLDEPNPATYTIEEKVELNNPTKVGYDFAGWTGTDETVKNTNVVIAVGSKGDREFTANYDIITYTLDYELDGGVWASGVVADTQYNIKSAPITLKNPEKKGYEFEGWTGTDETTANTEVVIATGSYGDRAYTANWAAKIIEISFDTNGGVPETLPSITAKVGSPIYAPTEPIKEGYEFAGWYDTQLVEKYDIPEFMPNEDKELKAKWVEAKYTLTIDYAGGQVGEDEEAEYYTEVVYAYSDVVMAPTQPTREHYAFTAWAPSIPDRMPNYDEQVVAVWEAKDYKYTFTDCVVADIEQPYGTPVSAPADPTKEGYVFLGWEPEIPATMTGNQEFTAQWQKSGLTKITIPKSVSVLVGQSIPMDPTYVPAVSDPERYTWEAAAGQMNVIVEVTPKDATTGEGNNIKGKAPGSAKVRVAYTELVDSDVVTAYSNWCAVNVYTKLANSDIVIAPNAPTIGVGAVAYLRAEETAGRQPLVDDVVWTTSNAKIAKIVSTDGGLCIVKGVKAGSATITASVANGSETVTVATCVVTVVPAVKSITIDGPECIVIGEAAKTYTATVLPNKAGVVTKVNWDAEGYYDESEEYRDYLTIDQDGKAIGVKAGETVIVAEATDGTGVYGAKIVTVVEKKADAIVITPPTVSSDDLLKKATGYPVGLKKTLTIEAEATYGGSEVGVYQKFAWESSDPKVATVTNEGVVKGIKAGTATITIKALDGGTATTKFDVEVVTQITKITLTGPKFVTFKANDTVTIKAKYAPKKYDAKRVDWTSSDTAIATVDDKGVVTMLKAGMVTITAECKEDKVAGVFILNIVEPTTALTITASKTEIGIGEKLALDVVKAPVTAYDQFTWKSSNKKIATVSKTGEVKGVKAGTVKITATATDGTKVKSAEFVMTVVKKVTGVTLDKTELQQFVGDVVTLKATILPKKTAGTLTWATNNKEVATVADGKVDIVGAGTAVITVTADEGYTASCVITSSLKRAAYVLIDAPASKLFVGDTMVLDALVVDKDGNEDISQAVEWSIPNKGQRKFASVDEDGIVTALKAGPVIIRATAKDGSKVKSDIKLTVQPTATYITLNKDEIELYSNFTDSKKVKLQTATLKATVGPKAAAKSAVLWGTDTPEDGPFFLIPSKSDKTMNIAVNNAWWAKNPTEDAAYGEVYAFAGSVMEECAVYIRRLPIQIGVGEVTKKEQTLELVKGKSVDLTKGLVFDDMAYWNYDEYKWTISKADKKLATISANGVLTAKKKLGEIKVTVEPKYWGNDAIDKTPVTFTVKIVDVLSTKIDGVDDRNDIPALPIITPFEDAIETVPAMDGMEAIIAE